MTPAPRGATLLGSMGPLPPRQKKVFKNARKRIGDLVKARVMSLAALGSGKDPKRTPLSEALDKWIELLRMKENARQQREAETMRANMTSMLGQSRNASDDEGSSSDTATSGSGSGTSRSQNRSIARKKKARIDHEAKPQAPFDRLCDILVRACPSRHLRQLILGLILRLIVWTRRRSRSIGGWSYRAVSCQ